MMKKQTLFFVSVLLMGLLLGSCGDDESGVTGTFELFSFMTTGCDDPVANLSLTVGDNGCGDIAGTEACLTGSITLNADNTFSVNAMITSVILSQDFSGNGSYTSSGNTITICDDTECFDGSLSGDEVTILIPAEDGCLLTIRGRR